MSNSRRAKARIASGLLIWLWAGPVAAEPVAAASTAAPAVTPGGASGLPAVLSRCVPGGRFADCTAALRETACSVQIKAGSRFYGVQVAHVVLNAPYLRMEVSTRNDAEQRIIRTALYLDGHELALRGSLMKWLTQRLTTARRGAAYGAGPALDCGSDGAGVAWFEGGAAQPQVQYALMTSPSVVPAKDEKKRQKLLLSAATDELALCFLLPQSPTGRGYVQQARFAALLPLLASSADVPSFSCREQSPGAASQTARRP